LSFRVDSCRIILILDLSYVGTPWTVLAVLGVLAILSSIYFILLLFDLYLLLFIQSSNYQEHKEHLELFPALNHFPYDLHRFLLDVFFIEVHRFITRIEGLQDDPFILFQDPLATRFFTIHLDDNNRS